MANIKIIEKKLLLDVGRFTTSREELKIMQNCAYCKKRIVTKVIVSIINLKSKEIEKVLNLSKSVVSRHMTGENIKPEIDIYIIEQVFGIKIKEYSLNG